MQTALTSADELPLSGVENHSQPAPSVNKYGLPAGMLEGGKVGNKGNRHGSPPERIRRLLRRGLKKSAPALNRIAAGTIAGPDILQAHISCAKCGCTPDCDTPWLEDLAALLQSRISDQLKAIDVQLKYGVGLPGSLTMDAIDGYNGALWAAVTDWATSHAIDDATLEPLRDGLQQVARSFAKQHKR